MKTLCYFSGFCDVCSICQFFFTFVICCDFFSHFKEIFRHRRYFDVVVGLAWL